MIIVSQDKDLIINFDNVTVIGITQNNSKEIDSITVDKKEQYLGTYETEERAKEVLQEIVKKYKDVIVNFNTGTVICHEQMVYEMPEE